MSINVLGIDHVVLRVADPERAQRFYCEVLGCREERRIDSIGLVQLRAGAALIDLLPAGRVLGGETDSDARNMDHFALRIEPFEEAALRAFLRSKDVEVGEFADRYGAEGSGRSLYITDPDGNLVELKGPARRQPRA